MKRIEDFPIGSWVVFTPGGSAVTGIKSKVVGHEEHLVVYRVPGIGTAKSLPESLVSVSPPYDAADRSADR